MHMTSMQCLFLLVFRKYGCAENTWSWINGRCCQSYSSGSESQSKLRLRREEGREGGRERGKREGERKEGGREGEREGGRRKEGGRERGREGLREKYVHNCVA